MDYLPDNCINKDDDDLSLDGFEPRAEDRPKPQCTICLKDLDRVPIIQCAECHNVSLCIQCFSLGLETQAHSCEHAYRIDRLHIPRDDSDWTLTEDRDLLQAVLECGYQNENDLGRRFPHRTTSEISKRVEELLSLTTAPLRCPLEVEPRPLIPYNCEVFRDEPLRYPRKDHYAKYHGGYSAPRGDFTVEYKNNAEQFLSNLSVSSDEEDSDIELTTALTSAIAEYHNEVLREREARKKVIREHALLSRKMTTKLTLFSRPKLLIAMTVLNRLDFDSLLEGFSMEDNLVLKVHRLRKYRRLGITRLRGIEMFDSLEQMRAENLKDIRTIKKVTPGQFAGPIVKGSGPQPLNIIDFPKFEDLSEEEKTLCSTGRILPEVFIKAKNMFMQISKDEGGVKLKNARQLLKIDVNKTRKIFNFLRDKKLIKEIRS